MKYAVVGQYNDGRESILSVFDTKEQAQLQVIDVMASPSVSKFSAVVIDEVRVDTSLDIVYYVSTTTDRFIPFAK